MNVLFMSLGSFDNLAVGSVHIDIMKRFAKNHDVYLACKSERRDNKPTQLSKEEGINVLRVRTGNIKNTNLIEKGISTVLLESQFKSAIIKFLPDVKFDLILYTTPPITFANVVNYIKNRDNAKSYLLLKDIFPQNAVDIGMLTENGLKSVIYKFFRKKEKKLYKVSDYIGCMSQANVDYVLKHNPEVNKDIVEICPNSAYIVDKSIDIDKRNAIRSKYDIPLDKKVFVYGGNLGKPQGIPFLVKCLETQKNNKDAYFVIIGNGTEFSRMQKFMDSCKPDNIKLMESLPKDDYDTFVAACDVGMVFLDHRFTIPNFPSRILSYMQAKLPVFCVTDPNTDVGTVCEEGGFGWWSESNDENAFAEKVNEILLSDLKLMGENGYRYLCENYSVDQSYDIIMKHFK